MALIDDFKARFPEFDDAVVDQYLPILEPLWPCYYGGDYTVACDKEAILNLIAHLTLLEVQASSSSPQSVASQSVGDVSQSFVAKDSSGFDNDFFASTKYGARFLYLTASNIGGVFV
jgi:hypothetical protein